MRLLHYIFIFAFALFGGNLFAQQNFEGSLQITYSDFPTQTGGSIVCKVKGSDLAMTYDVKGGKEPGQYQVVVKAAEQNLYFFKGGTEGNMLKVPFSSVKGNTDAGRVTTYAEEKQIAGYACKKVVVENSTRRFEFWVTEAIKVDFTALKALQSGENGWSALAAANIKGTPLEILATDLSGKQLYQQQVVSVQQETVSPAAFAVPTGQTVQTPNDLFKAPAQGK